MRTTPLFWAYSAATRVALPFVMRTERQKLRAASVEESRLGEKLGYATAARPDGQVLWFHAASVGESLSVLSLIDRLGRALPDSAFLITSGTPTSARLLEQRMPERCRHQFAPLDAPAPLARFLAHWRPDAAIFVESELWPNMLARTQRAGVPLALLNARLSDKTLQNWGKFPGTAKYLLSGFRLILTQTNALAQALIGLGADPDVVSKGVNLKSLAAPLPVNDTLVADMRRALGTRPVWIAASTHAGEEPIILDAHDTLLRTHPDACLILAPRHPERGGEVADLITKRGWSAPRRSAGALPEGPVYLADSLGELGSWYSLSPIVFLGGSLLAIGGHNPFEVAQSGGAVLSGPHVTNFVDIFADMTRAGAALRVATAPELAEAIDTWLSEPNKLDAARTASAAFRAGQLEHLDAVGAQLIGALELLPNGGSDA